MLREVWMAVVVTAASGFDLGYVWKNQAGQAEPERSAGGYYINAAQAGEPPGRWWGPGARALGFSDGQVVERRPYEMVYRQLDPRTGEKLGRSRGNYAEVRRSSGPAPGGRAARDGRAAAGAGARGRPGDPAGAGLHGHDGVAVEVDLGVPRLHPGERAPGSAGGRFGRRGALGRGRARGTRRWCRPPTGRGWSTCRSGPG